MNIVKPGKSIMVSEESSELARAILDDKMEPFNGEIQEQLASFTCRKTDLLSLLFDDYNNARPSAKHEKAWGQIETIAYKYFARQILRHTVTDHAHLVARYRAISDAAKDARIKIEKKTWPDLAAKPLKAWLEGTAVLDDSTQEFGNRLDVELDLDGKIDQARKSLANLETAALRAAANAPPGQSGKPAILPRGFILVLADIYQTSTGRAPGSGSGPFYRFIVQFRTAVNPSYNPTDESTGSRVDQSMVDAIKLALGKRRKRPKRSNRPKRRSLIPYAGQGK